MILSLVSWIWIFAFSFILGFGMLFPIKRNNINSTRIDYILVWGLCIATVYAQVFSLMHKVGRLAIFLLAVISFGIFLLLWRQIWTYVLTALRGKEAIVPFVTLLIGGIFLWLSIGEPGHYDTDLYHGQFIRWIEEYGVVKGLGNLHNRFGYNSAFFSLQALYSFKFMLNQSMHSLNCFAAVIFIVYAISTLSLWEKQCLRISDFLKIGILFYYAKTFLSVASPNSDSLTLALVLYISAKWAELTEDKKQESIEYGLLCLLAVWALTLKVSAGIFVLLTIYPATLLIKEKRWKTVLSFLISGVAILLPFLIRNVLISGYLLYPYASLDLFDVDWKMPRDIVDMDQLSIMAWARGMIQPELYKASFTQWFPVWYQNMDIDYKILFVLNIICIVGLLVAGLSVWKKRRFSIPMFILTLSSMMQMLMWFVSAPLIRYGSVYLLLLPAVCFGMLCQYIRIKQIPYVLVSIVIVASLVSMVIYDARYVDFVLKRPRDYIHRECREVVWEGMIVYVSVEDDRAGYHYFPGIPSEYYLDSIELRGENLADGFSVRNK